MALNTYLTFDGNCREAFEFYRSVFGGDFSVIQTFADGPPDMPGRDELGDRIMHVSLPVGGNVLMGSDRGPGFGPEVVVGNNFSISIDRTEPAALRRGVREAVRRRQGDYADAGPVLGLVLRDVHGQVRHQLDARLRAAARLSGTAVALRPGVVVDAAELAVAGAETAGGALDA